MFYLFIWVFLHNILHISLFGSIESSTRVTKHMLHYSSCPMAGRKWKWSRSVVSDSLRPMNRSPLSSSVHGILQARILEYFHFLLQGIFLTQGSNPGLPHCGQTLYHLSHQGSLWPKEVKCKAKCDALTQAGSGMFVTVIFRMGIFWLDYIYYVQ